MMNRIYSVSLLAAVIILSCFADGEKVLVEVVSVQGCARDSSPLRETRGCFAGRTEEEVMPREERLSIRGLHFPVKKSDGTDVSFRVDLIESAPPSLTGSSQGELLRLNCIDAKASSMFPDQLVTCQLVHPNTTLMVSKRDQWERLRKGAMWFDVLLHANTGGGSSYDPLSRLRHAVEVDITEVVAPASSARGSTKDDTNSHPLERLYAQKGEGLSDDLWVELGIGGLKKELRTLFRRVFLSRLPSLGNITETLGLQHVRGVILHGPPGNGKTLIARSLIKLFGPDTQLTVINAAEVLSKYVGESEKNLRDLFEGYASGTTVKEEDDEEDDRKGREKKHSGAKTRPTSGRLRVLVIDEFEALFRRRGGSSDESSAKAVYDGVTNTLLSLMDGLYSRNDLLVIGLTNRLQSIDTALLRPGRFEVLIDVPSPDADGREEIFFIHTGAVRDGNYLAEDVSLEDLAAATGGFSGSDIAGTVRSAVSYALMRFREDSDAQGCSATLSSRNPSCDGAKADGFKVSAADFARAIKDIRSAKDEMSSLTYITADSDDKTELVDHDITLSANVERVNGLVDQVMNSNRVFTGVVALSGGTGTGKTSVAQELARQLPFLTVRYLSCRRLVEVPDRHEQLAQVRDAFSEASRTESGLVVLDDLDVFQDSLSGYPLLEASFKNMLYEYTHRRQGVSRSIISRNSDKNAGDAEVPLHSGGNEDHNNRRLLFVTATRQDAFRELHYDIHMRTHPVNRQGVHTLLSHYRIVNTSDAKRVAPVFPAMISYRDFLRVADMALWKLKTKVRSGTAPGGVEDFKMPWYFDTNSSEERVQQEEADFYALSTRVMLGAFRSCVHEVVASMALGDPFAGWNNYRAAGAFAGEAASDAGPPEEGTGDGLEVLW